MDILSNDKFLMYPDIEKICFVWHLLVFVHWSFVFSLILDFPFCSDNFQLFRSSFRCIHKNYSSPLFSHIIYRYPCVLVVYTNLLFVHCNPFQCLKWHGNVLSDLVVLSLTTWSFARQIVFVGSTHKAPFSSHDYIVKLV